MDAAALSNARLGRAVAFAWRVSVVSGLALLAVHFGFGAWGHAADRLFNAWIYDVVEALAALGVLTRAAVIREERWAWMSIGIALAATTGGDVLFDHVYGGNPPFPSYADVSYLSFYPACYVGIGLLLRSRISRFSASLWLDGVMAAAAAAAVSAAVLVSVVVNSTHGSRLVVLTNLAYPIGDTLLLAGVFLVFAVTRWRPGRAWSLLAVGLLVVALGDGTFLYQTASNTYAEGTLLDITWPTSLVLLAFAAWQAPERARSRALEQRSLLGTPIACGLVSVAVFVAGSASNAVHPVAVAFAALTILLILARTALMFRENRALLEQSQAEALTDALTGLANRRKLVADLESALEEAEAGAPRLLAIFDLNGFKRYNDTFGHPAGDALLARLAAKLEAAVAPDGIAYRMGGDEFCVLIPASDPLLARATNALSDNGESFSVTSSCGAVMIPREATTASEALRTADERLYRQKELLPANRGAAHEPLLRTLAEREPGLREHVAVVSSLACEVGLSLGFESSELE